MKNAYMYRMVPM